MGGKLLNTTYHDTVQEITGFYKDLVNNPFYTFNDKKATICTYYNINKDFTSVDPGSKIHMDNLGDESPIRFNKINDFLLYGFSKIELNTDRDEFGVEANKIEGECYILPNTIVPTEGDYFEIDHIQDSKYLFIVKDVQKDTLDNGSNVYKLSYRLDQTNNENIQENILYNFTLIEKREGTNIVKVVRCEDYEIAKLMDMKAVKLKEYYNELFYNSNVQTYIYEDLTNLRIYDPFMIEFLIRNKILSNGENSYTYIDHKISVSKTFSIEYDKTFFRAFEKKDKENLSLYNRKTCFEEIKGYGTLFSARYEEYYKANYKESSGYNILCLDEDLLYKIQDNTLIEDTKEYNTKSELWKNIIIKYFNNTTYTDNEIISIDEINYEYSKDMFYIIPLLIYCLEIAIENALK